MSVHASRLRSRQSGRPPVSLAGPNGVLRVARRVLREEAFLRATPHLRGPVTTRILTTFAGQGAVNGWVSRLPPVPRAIDRLRYAPIPVWSAYRASTPARLRSVAGVRRDPAVAGQAFRQQPLHDFVRTHFEAFRFMQSSAWNYIGPSLPRMLRGYGRINSALESAPLVPARPIVTDPQRLSETIRGEAVRLGLSTIGFARYDPRYTFAEYADDTCENVIVCIVEQDYAATQTAPSGRAERAAFRAYAELIGRVGELAQFVQRQGYAASPQDFAGHAVVIHYGVEAGLGQLGLNGQLLTPQAGSRCRIALITTAAPVVAGEPLDYGIEKICDACQVCVRRCPVGAIPIARSEHRGVVKAKIKPERCMPTMIQSHGCAVCMKVCPVQRHGLEDVSSHFEKTGEILGRGTDDLEGYAWPIDGRFYGAGSKPRIDVEFVKPEGWQFDKTRTQPPVQGGSPFDLTRS